MVNHIFNDTICIQYVKHYSKQYVAN